MTWMPRSGLDSLEEVVWLPRLFDKARRSALNGNARLTDGYCFGNNDFVDSKVLRFLRIEDTAVSALLRDHSDEEAARIIVSRSGRSADECRRFSRALKRSMANFSLMEADEGRLPSGFKSAALHFFYNSIMMPIVYPVFRRAERKRVDRE